MTLSEKAAVSVICYYFLHHRRKGYFPYFNYPTRVKFHGTGLDKNIFAIGVDRLTLTNINLYDETEGLARHQTLNDKPMKPDRFELRHTELQNTLHFDHIQDHYFMVHEDRYSTYYQVEWKDDRYLRFIPSSNSENEVLVELS